jgi:hypothetical protein
MVEDAMKIHGSNGEPRQADANELRALYVAMMDGWNRGSGEAFAAPFADDMDFVAFDGTRFRTRDELIRTHDPSRTATRVWSESRSGAIGKNALGTLCWLIGDWFWRWCLPKSHFPVSLEA